MNCGQCKYLIDIDKSQDGGTCQLSCTFHKFHNICDLEDGFEADVRQTTLRKVGENRICDKCYKEN